MMNKLKLYSWSVSLYSGKAHAKGLANIRQLVTIAR